GKCEVDLTLELGFLCTCNQGRLGLQCQDRIAPVTASMLRGRLFRDNTPATTPLEDGGLGEAPAHLLGEVITVDTSELKTTPTETTQTSWEALSFNQESYIMTSSMNASQPRRTDAFMRIRRRSNADGLLLYNEGENSFVSIAIHSGAVEFRYGDGYDTAILRSPIATLGVGSWHSIRVVRRRSRGRLDVDGRTVARGRISSSGDLHLTSPMFIGGVRFWDRIPERVGVRDGFDGCIEGLRIDEMEVPFNEMFLMKNTRSCDVDPPTNSLGEFVDQTSFCAVLPELPPPRHTARFNGDSFASFLPTTFPHDGVAEQISFDFIASSPEGLVLFHGEELASEDNNARLHRRRVRSKDYISVGVQGSKLVYSFELGGGQGKAISDFSVADGLWHHVTILRRGSLALMWLDDLPTPVASQAPGTHTVANAPGRLYVGGAPDVVFATAGRYRSGFVGCVSNLRFTGIPLDRANELGPRFL
uniref:Laminin G domain-containing protein n=1 Tax=Ciona savignyi TaxID=51511 RepID=H2YI69_CIOSA